MHVGIWKIWVWQARRAKNPIEKRAFGYPQHEIVKTLGSFSYEWIVSRNFEALGKPTKSYNEATALQNKHIVGSCDLKRWPSFKENVIISCMSEKFGKGTFLEASLSPFTRSMIGENGNKSQNTLCLLWSMCDDIFQYVQVRCE